MPSLIRHPYLIRHAVRHFATFLLGWREAHDSEGATYDNDPLAPRSLAYDAGRDLRRWGRA